LSILFLYIIFIFYYQKQEIISDCGYYKILIFTIGITFYFISNYFITYSDYTGCSLNFLFKHIGDSISLVILFIYIVFGTNFGMQNVVNEKFKFSSNLNDDLNSNNLNYDGNLSRNIITIGSEKNKTLNQNNNKNRLDNSKLFNQISNLNLSDEIINKVRMTRSLYIHTIFIYLIYILFIIFMILYVKSRYKDDVIISVQENDGKFSYQCQLENYDIIFYLIKLFMHVVILIQGNKILMFNYIFVCIKYITYTSLIGIAFGPTANVTKINEYINY